MSDCLFCAIASGAVPAKEVYADDRIIAIEDIHPQAPVHLLVMPRTHYANVAALADAGDDALIARLTTVAARLGRERGAGGFRLAINTGSDGGQTVDHAHIHVLAGRPMTWPPG